MANNFFSITIPQGSNIDVCQSQSVLTNGFLVLNGVTGGDFISNNYSRNLSFTSSNDLSAMFFTIIGLQNGARVTETVTGPNANTVYSTKNYDSISSIQASAGALDISVGSGDMSYVFYDSGAGFAASRFMTPYMTLSIDNPAGDVITSVYGLVNFPANMINWAPGNQVALTNGTRSVKAPDDSMEYQLTAANLQLYRGYIVIVEGFPSGNVYVNIVQP